MTSPLLHTLKEGVAHIRFNRPDRLNALDLAMALAFREAVLASVSDPDVRVVVLSGEGRAFMAGGDLAYLKGAADREAAARALIGPINEALLSLAGSGIPSIAALRGPVAGAGMSLALSADLAVASADVRFSMAYLKVAATTDCGGSWALGRLIGQRRALELALLGGTVEAAEALALGLVNRVVEPADLDASVEALAVRIAAGPPLATRLTRRLIVDGATTDLGDQLAREIDAFAACAATEDFGEALSAFFDKRAPAFTGR